MFIPRDDFPKDMGGDAGSETAPGVGDGASGTSTSSISISTGGLVAIIVVVIAVAIAGIVTATLFFIAKKREWTMKETLRRSARKVKTALTPRRSEFPAHLKDPESSSSRSRKGRARIADDVPPTPKLRPDFIEKAMHKAEVKQKGRK